MSKTIQATQSHIRDIFTQKGFDNPSLEARYLMQEALSLTPTELILQEEKSLTLSAVSHIHCLAKQRLAAIPLSRIKGEREFFGLPFGLNQDSFDPRPDSEILVEVALDKSAHLSSPDVLDLGTGSGALLLSYLFHKKNAKGLGVDVAQYALCQAKTNADHLGLSPRALFLKSNWFEDVQGRFDIIFANPPYIPTDQIQKLPKEVQQDPDGALDGGEDGCQAYREIAKYIGSYMKPNGWALFEFGTRQQGVMLGHILKHQGFHTTSYFKDLAGNQRLLAVKAP